MHGGTWIWLPAAVVAAATVLSAVLLFSRPVVRLSYVRGPEKGGGTVEAAWMGVKIPVVRWEDGGGFRRAGRWRPERFVRRRDAAVRLLRDAECTEFRWKTDIGLEDAALTAVAAGVCWAVVSSLVGWGSRFVRPAARPDVRVRPVYGETVFSTELSVAVRIRMYRLAAEALRAAAETIRSVAAASASHSPDRRRRRPRERE